VEPSGSGGRRPHRRLGHPPQVTLQVGLVNSDPVDPSGHPVAAHEPDGQEWPCRPGNRRARPDRHRPMVPISASATDGRWTWAVTPTGLCREFPARRMIYDSLIGDGAAGFPGPAGGIDQVGLPRRSERSTGDRSVREGRDGRGVPPVAAAQLAAAQLVAAQLVVARRSLVTTPWRGASTRRHWPMTGESPAVGPALDLARVSVVRDRTPLLDDVSWVVGRHERWALLGPNGSGKTTLLKVVGASLWPTRGVVEILGARLGRVDMRELRQRIAMVSAAVSRTLRAGLPALDVVLTGRHAALEIWWNEYSEEDRDEARSLLAEAGFGGAGFAERPFGLLSEGERQQVLLARALMGRPELLLMDEPAAGLDLGARERLLGHLASLAGDPTVPPLVFVTHHLEEIPPGVTHAALLRGARLLAAGPVDSVLTGDAVSEAFGVNVVVERRDDRWSARAAP